jgi:hypothetical protein
MSAKGLFWKEDWTTSGDDAAPPVFVCGRLHVLAQNCDDNSDEWGVLVRWSDPNNVVHTWAIPKTFIVGDGLEVARGLAGGGLRVGQSRKAREKLAQFLMDIEVDRRCCAVGTSMP